MEFRYTVNNFTYNFKDLKTLMAKASPYRTGDALAGISAETNE
ncbi:ethanolamine ammonia-lyase subunit EutB, partial [Lacihabitans soyangensis]